MNIRLNLFILVLFGCNFVLPLKNHDDSSDNVKKKAALFHRLFKREMECFKGAYSAGKHCCKLCKAGTHVQEDCTEAYGYPSCNNCTEGVDYMDEENGYKMCLKCPVCDSGFALELLEKCTVCKKTVCKCKETFFCKENTILDSEGCTECQHCTLCEYGVAEPCTATKDTVCRPQRKHILATMVILTGFVIALGIIIWIWCTKNVAGNGGVKTLLTVPGKSRTQDLRDNPESPGQERIQHPIFPDHLEDINFSRHLHDITLAMDSDTVLMFVRKMGFTEPQIDTVEQDNPKDRHEMKLQLLRKWYESHGQSGAFKKLITTLQNSNKRVVAERLIQLVQRQNSEL